MTDREKKTSSSRDIWLVITAGFAACISVYTAWSSVVITVAREQVAPLEMTKSQWNQVAAYLNECHRLISKQKINLEEPIASYIFAVRDGRITLPEAIDAARFNKEKLDSALTELALLEAKLEFLEEKLEEVEERERTRRIERLGDTLRKERVRLLLESKGYHLGGWP
ncbi:MAG: hypothetical protein HQL66_10215 [Magnetococcales bacterium]|nr:hypothetical protein [Magnetococcales bacterium]